MPSCPVCGAADSTCGGPAEVNHLIDVFTPPKNQRMWRSEERLYLNDSGAVVGAKDPSKVRLLVAENGDIPYDLAVSLGLVESPLTAAEGPDDTEDLGDPKEARIAALMAMGRRELLARCEELGSVPASPGHRNKNLIEAILAHEFSETPVSHEAEPDPDESSFEASADLEDKEDLPDQEEAESESVTDEPSE